MKESVNIERVFTPTLIDWRPPGQHGNLSAAAPGSFVANFLHGNRSSLEPVKEARLRRPDARTAGFMPRGFTLTPFSMSYRLGVVAPAGQLVSFSARFSEYFSDPALRLADVLDVQPLLQLAAA